MPIFPISDVVIYDEEGNPVDLNSNVINLQTLSDDIHNAVDPSTGKLSITSDGTSTNTKQGMTSKEFEVGDIGKINEYILEPNFISENSPSSNGHLELSENEKIVQVIKASSDNFQKVDMMLSYQGASSDPVIDLIEGYTSESDIEAVWVSSNQNQIDVYYETQGLPSGSTQCLAMYTDTNAEGETVTKTFVTPQNYHAMINLSFWWYQSRRQNDIFYYFQFIDNNGQIAEQKITITNHGTWEFKDFLLSDFYTITSGTFDWTIVKSVRFYCYDADRSDDVYVDQILLSAPNSNLIENTKVELYHYNGTGEPTGTLDLSNDFDLLSTDSGITSSEILVDCIAPCKKTFGFDNGIHELIKDDYYAIVLTSIASEKMNVEYYDSSLDSIPVKKYQSGNLYTIAPSSTSLVLKQDSSLRFAAYSKSDIYLKRLQFSCEDIPKRSSMRILLIENGHIIQMLMDDKKIYNFTAGELIIESQLIKANQKLLFVLKHDIESNMLRFNIDLIFMYNFIVMNN